MRASSGFGGAVALGSKRYTLLDPLFLAPWYSVGAELSAGSVSP